MSNSESKTAKGTGFPLIPHPSSLIPYTTSLILLLTSLLLSSCGFHLRGQAALPFDTLYISGSPQFTGQLTRMVRAGSQTRITDNPQEARVTLEILGEQRERAILSLSSSGRVREITLSYRVSYRVYDQKKKEYVQNSQIALRRDLSYTDTDVVGKEQEEALLYRDMQSDAVQQMVRRLQATRIDS
jgi:LPS-assembly lipoprotein